MYVANALLLIIYLLLMLSQHYDNALFVGIGRSITRMHGFNVVVKLTVGLHLVAGNRHGVSPFARRQLGRIVRAVAATIGKAESDEE